MYAGQHYSLGTEFLGLAARTLRIKLDRAVKAVYRGYKCPYCGCYSYYREAKAEKRFERERILVESQCQG